MVKIRLRRMGAKKSPFYRIVVADSPWSSRQKSRLTRNALRLGSRLVLSLLIP